MIFRPLCRRQSVGVSCRRVLSIDPHRFLWAYLLSASYAYSSELLGVEHRVPKFGLLCRCYSRQWPTPQPSVQLRISSSIGYLSSPAKVECRIRIEGIPQALVLPPVLLRPPNAQPAPVSGPLTSELRKPQSLTADSSMCGNQLY